MSHHVWSDPDHIRCMCNTSSTELVFEIVCERAQCAGAPRHVSLVHFEASALPHSHTALEKEIRAGGESAEGDKELLGSYRNWKTLSGDLLG